MAGTPLLALPSPLVALVLLFAWLSPSVAQVCPLRADFQCPCDYFTTSFQPAIAQVMSRQATIDRSTVTDRSQIRFDEGPQCLSLSMVYKREFEGLTPNADVPPVEYLSESYDLSQLCQGIVFYSFTGISLNGLPDVSCNATVVRGSPSCCADDFGDCPVIITMQTAPLSDGLIQVLLQRSGTYVPFPLSTFSAFTPFTHNSLPACARVPESSSSSKTSAGFWAWIIVAVVVVVLVAVLTCMSVGLLMFWRWRQEAALAANPR
eukprot:RCo048040